MRKSQSLHCLRFASGCFVRFRGLRIELAFGSVRTLEGRQHLPVFKTGGFNRSATSPCFLLCLSEKPRARRGFLMMAEREGFEPSVRGYRTLAFQASPFDRSGTSP